MLRTVYKLLGLYNQHSGLIGHSFIPKYSYTNLDLDFLLLVYKTSLSSFYILLKSDTTSF